MFNVFLHSCSSVLLLYLVHIYDTKVRACVQPALSVRAATRQLASLSTR